MARQRARLTTARTALCVPGLGGALGLLALVMCLVLPVRAEMAGDDYRSPTVLSSPQERARVADELEAERRRMALEAEQQQKAHASMIERRRLQDELRPVGERLLDAKCTGCHALNTVTSQSKSALGWRWTVERMRWWHGAPLKGGEAAVIAQHLAPAGPSAGAVIWLVVGAGAGTAGLVIFLGRKRFNRRRGKLGTPAKECE